MSSEVCKAAWLCCPNGSTHLTLSKGTVCTGRDDDPGLGHLAAGPCYAAHVAYATRWFCVTRPGEASCPGFATNSACTLATNWCHCTHRHSTVSLSTLRSVSYYMHDMHYIQGACIILRSGSSGSASWLCCVLQYVCPFCSVCFKYNPMLSCCLCFFQTFMTKRNSMCTLTRMTTMCASVQGKQHQIGSAYS